MQKALAGKSPRERAFELISGTKVRDPEVRKKLFECSKAAVYAAKDRDRALVGRLRPDARDASHKTLCLTVVGDNLRLGAATNAVRIASRWFKSEDAELQA